MPDEPRKTLEAALVELGFKHVVYVDDAFDRDSLDIEGLIVWLGAETNRNASKGILNAQEAGVNPEDDQFAALFRTFAENVDHKDKLAAIRKSVDSKVDAEAQGDDADLHKRHATDRIILTRFSEIMRGLEGVTFTDAGLAKWNTDKETLVTRAKTERTLFVFDQELGDQKFGAEEIKGLTGDLGESDTVYILLSYKVEPNKEHEETRKLRSEGLAVTAIPKRDIKETGSEEFLTLRIKAALMAKESDPILSAFRRAMKASSKAVADRVESLTGLEFDELVMRSSSKEGVHELDTLIRIYANGFAAELRSRLRGKEALHDAITKARRYSVASESKHAKIGSEAWKLYREELYESGEYINDCNAPLDAGDVFRLTGQDGTDIGTFVLIAQPCDLMVRNVNGKRRANELLLAKIEHREPLKFDNGTLKEKKAFELPFFGDDGKISMIDFSEVFRIDGRFLDLCCLHRNGLAEVVVVENPKGLTPGWSKRWQDITKPFITEVQSSLETWENLPVDQQAVGDTLPIHVLTFNGTTRIKLAVEVRRRKKYVVLGIKRSMRLSSAMAALMLRAFGDYLSRPARPHALAEPPSVS